ncbi:CDP-6-deoxy-delta-3,4-glucoseen reductase [Azotobacter bryophylli]|uniref:CDP-6-deoxy-delta-3,4-glucoseen reductase n=1 Tax=Azotobacter bryophylli TaxID=1986537 RepID=A0ABV7ATI1_9GAMM
MKFHVDIQPSGQTFGLDAGRTILDGALAEGLMLRHSCRTGACGSCKGKIASGSVDHGESPLSVLPEAERAAGLALFCCARPTSDLVIDAPEVTALRGVTVQQMGVRVASIDRAGDDVAIVRLMLPPGSRFDYYAGQYAQVLLKDGSRRSYSMATRAAADGQIEWHIRRVPGGAFSGFVFDGLKPKTVLRLEGPFGSFYLRDGSGPLVFLATGTGFAPIRALLEELRERAANRPVHLYWGGRRRQDLYRHDELFALQAELPWLQYTPVLSRPSAACDWQGATGHVQDRVLEDFASLKDAEVYACGSPAMIDAARRLFVAERQLEEGRFYADAFV